MTLSKNALSPRELALALGVSESSMKRWIDAGHLKAARTTGGHRRVPQREAIRFVREQRLTIADPVALGLSGVDLANGEPLTADALVASLTAHDARPAEALLVAAYLRGESLAALFDGSVREALEHLGVLWKKGDAGIVFEHRAIDLLVRAVNRIRSLQAEPDEGAPVAVGGAIAGDPYMLPSLMAATVIAEVGYHVTNLGPDTPNSALVEAERRLDADLLWLSVSRDISDEDLDATLRDLTASVASTPLAVGGRGTEAKTLAQIEGVQVLPSMSALESYVAAIQASVRA